MLPPVTHTPISLAAYTVIAADRTRFIWLPITEEHRRRLLCLHSSDAFQRRNSEVIFNNFLLIPGSHRPRLSATFGKYLLSSSSSFHVNIIRPQFWECQEKCAGLLPRFLSDELSSVLNGCYLQRLNLCQQSVL